MVDRTKPTWTETKTLRFDLMTGPAGSGGQVFNQGGFDQAYADEC